MDVAEGLMALIVFGMVVFTGVWAYRKEKKEGKQDSGRELKMP